MAEASESVLTKTDECPDDECGSTESSRSVMDVLQELLLSKLRLGGGEEKPIQVLDEVSFDGVVRYMASDKCKNIIVMVGAGISTCAGIPDFRSPKSGIYANLQKYNLPNPMAIFDINYFKENPSPFFQLAKEIYPGKYKPTVCHYFLRLLHEKKKLLRLYTQNVDTLEILAGLPADKVVDAHGTFHTSHCINPSCRKLYTLEWMREKIFSDEVPTCTECQDTVKPDIVFFGERLPERFFVSAEEDFPICDLLIIIGTSLSVQPFAGLVDNSPAKTPRFLINKEKVGQSMYPIVLGPGLQFDSEANYRDVMWEGLCDDGCQALADALGWGEELKKLVKDEHACIDREREQ